jgi:hypothetical protein
MGEDDATTLRLKLGLYRRYLAEGASRELAHIYLTEIVKLQGLLDEIERGEKKR